MTNPHSKKTAKKAANDNGNKVPPNGKGNVYYRPPADNAKKNAQLKLNKTKVSTTDNEEKETEPKEENKVPVNENGNVYYRPPADNAKKNAQLNLNETKVSTTDNEEKETDNEPKDKMYQIFPWIMLFYRVLAIFLSFAVLCCFVALQFRKNTTEIYWKSFNSSLPAVHHLLQTDALILWLAKFIAIAVVIVGVSLLLLSIWMSYYMSKMMERDRIADEKSKEKFEQAQLELNMMRMKFLFKMAE